MTIEALLEAHSTQREALASRVLATLEHEWNVLGSWDEKDVARFVSRVVPVVVGAQSVTARMVDVYVSQVLTEMLGKRVNPAGIPQASLTDIRGVSPAEVYRRPFVELWTSLKEGNLFEDAKNSGLARLQEIADDDLSLAYRSASRDAMADAPVKGFRRVIRPELSRGGSCPLCQLASQNIYKRDDLMPIHTHCRCSVVPIVGDADPGKRLNDEDLGPIDSPERPVIRDHGELGPTLQVSGQHFEAQVA